MSEVSGAAPVYAAPETGADAALARFILDLRSRGLMDPALLTAFERLPRAEFLPGQALRHIYAPIALPLPCGEEATDPFTLARQLVLMDLNPGMSVLEIGTGSGFLSALMARLGCKVTSFERYRTLLKQAERRFRHLGIGDVRAFLGDGLARHDSPETYDRIIVNGAVEAMPNHLFDRLKTGGMALASRHNGKETRLFSWKRDLSGFPVSVDCGPSRAGAMREGLPTIL